MPNQGGEESSSSNTQPRDSTHSGGVWDGPNLPIPPRPRRIPTDASNRASLVFQRLHASVAPPLLPLSSPSRHSTHSSHLQNTPRVLGRSLTEGSRGQRNSTSESIWTQQRQSMAQSPASSVHDHQLLRLGLVTPEMHSSQSLPHPWSLPTDPPHLVGGREDRRRSSASVSAYGRTVQTHASGHLGAIEETDSSSSHIPETLASAETEPLLGAEPGDSIGSGSPFSIQNPSPSPSQRIIGTAKSAKDYVAGWISGLSTPHMNVLKAVLAYAIASLFPFVPYLRDWLGDPDYMSPHLVTNATIWYHAAKSRSGLAEGGLVGLVWVLVTSCVTYTALFIAEWLHCQYAQDPTTSVLSLLQKAAKDGDVPEALPLAVQSKVVSLVVFIFGYSWCLAFFKANANRPSVGTATAISNIVLYLVMLREAPIVNYKAAANEDMDAAAALLKGNGKIPWPFPSDSESLAESVGRKTEHIFVAVLTGMTISLLVGWFVRPTTAGQGLRKQLHTTFSSFRDLLPQLLAPIVSERTPSNTKEKLQGAKPEELKEGLRAHRQRLQQLKKQLGAIALEPTEWHVWARRKKLAALIACLDGLSLHLSSMSSGLELRVIDHNSDAFEGDLDAAAYSAIIQRIRVPVVQLGRMCDKTLMAIQDMVDAALDRDQQQQSGQQHAMYYEGICECPPQSRSAGPLSTCANEFDVGAQQDAAPDSDEEQSLLCDTCLRPTDYDPVSKKIMRLRVEMVDAIQAFHDDYDEAVNDLANIPLSPQARSLAGPILDSPSKWQPPTLPPQLPKPAAANSSSTTEEQLFIVYFFVFSMREFVDELFGILPQVAAVCRPPRPLRSAFRRNLQPRKLLHRVRSFADWVAGHFWALWDTGATTELETRYEVAQFTDPRSLHAPRPTTRLQRAAQAIWRACMWARRLNVKFATKYALLITALSLPCYWSMDVYLEFRRQRLEWMVISAAAIMVPTVGGSALVSVYRILGTCAGGLAAFLVYEIGKDTPPLAYVLLVLFSIPCFHIILNGKYPKIGQFALITFGVVLINKWVAREDQSESAGGLAVRRTASVALGVIAGMVTTMYVWPYEARVRVRQALSWWLLTGSLLYDQLWNSLWHSYVSPTAAAGTKLGPQAKAQASCENTDAPAVQSAPADNGSSVNKQGGAGASTEWHALTTVRDYLDNELQLQESLMEIRTLLNDTQNEPRLKGPFPIATYQRILNACQRLLDAMVAARWVMLPVPMVVATRLHHFPPPPPPPQPKPQGRGNRHQQTQHTGELLGNSELLPGNSAAAVSANLLSTFVPADQGTSDIAITISRDFNDRGSGGDQADVDEQLANIKYALNQISAHRRRGSDASSSSEGSDNIGRRHPHSDDDNEGRRGGGGSDGDSASVSTDRSVLESGNTTEEEAGRLLLDLPIGMASTVMLEREQHELDSLILGQHPRPHSPFSRHTTRTDGETRHGDADVPEVNCRRVHLSFARDGYDGDSDDSDDSDGDGEQFGRWDRDSEHDISRRIRQHVEEDLLKRTAAEREQRDALVSLTMYVLASALILKTPLPAVLPPIHAAQKRVAETMRHILDPTTTAANHIAGLDSSSTESDSSGDDSGEPRHGRRKAGKQKTDELTAGSSDDEDEEEESQRVIQRAVARIRYVFYYTQVMLGWEVVQELTIIGGLMRDLYGSYGPRPSSSSSAYDSPSLPR
ncbi:hypothetical protein GQ54DRAFT_181701 [Martensiomyces pterosporus]|nr:hypothetical protein GQ54DRAFT_181701 [Martensiomyces pterosporus]